jgi:hypothetical protein
MNWEQNFTQYDIFAREIVSKEKLNNRKQQSQKNR